MKKTVIILLAVITALSALVSCGRLPIGGPTSGSTGDCTWTLDGKVLTISGNGSMGMHGMFMTPPWGDDITKVIIEDGVTFIAPYSFYECSSLKSISIPDSVTAIGESAFWDCVSLKDVDINCVEHINRSAFCGCSSLQSVNIPARVDFIAEGAFSGCTSLKSITVSSGNEKYYAKGNCLIEKSTNKLIAGCKASVIPDSVESIAYLAFSGCSFTSITIPSNVRDIFNDAFSGCKELKTIYIHSSTVAEDLAKENFTSLSGVKEYCYVETFYVESSIVNVSSFISEMPYKTENVMIDGVKYTAYSKKSN